jgi:hypothetical protein
MITVQSQVNVEGITSKKIIDFMLNCTDSDYQEWWPGTHLAWHTIRQVPGVIGNIVYFDEFVGKKRLKFRAVVTKLDPGRTITWQILKGITLPVWVTLELEERPEGLSIQHTLSLGYEGVGQILDPFLRVYFSDAFIADMDDHAQTEFQLLAKLLIERR